MTQLADSSPPGIAPPRLTAVYGSFKEFVEQSATWLLKSRIFVETDKAIPVGTSVRAEIALAHGPVLIRGLGEVAQIDEESEDDGQEKGVALRIIYLDPASARLIASVLRHQGHQESRSFAVAKSFPTPAGAVVRGVPEGWSEKPGAENWETDVGSFVDEALQEPGFAAAGEADDESGVEPEDEAFEEETFLEETIDEEPLESVDEAEIKTTPLDAEAALRTQPMELAAFKEAIEKADEAAGEEPADEEPQPQPAALSTKEIETAPEAAEPDVAQPDVAQPDVAQPDVAQPDAAQPDAAEIVADLPGSAPEVDVAADETVPFFTYPGSDGTEAEPEPALPSAAKAAASGLELGTEDAGDAYLSVDPFVLGDGDAPAARDIGDETSPDWKSFREETLSESSQENLLDEVALRPESQVETTPADRMDLGTEGSGDQTPASFAMKARDADGPRRIFPLALAFAAVIAVGFFLGRGWLAGLLQGGPDDPVVTATPPDDPPASPPPVGTGTPVVETPPPPVVEPPPPVVEPPPPVVEPPPPAVSETATTAPSATAPSATAPSAFEEEVRRHVTAWARAWADQRVDDYLASYADDFRPASGLSHQAWVAQRHQRLTAPVSISVRLEELDVTVIDARQARARFRQFFDAGSGVRTTVKVMELTRQERGWKIVQERLGN